MNGKLFSMPIISFFVNILINTFHSIVNVVFRDIHCIVKINLIKMTGLLFSCIRNGMFLILSNSYLVDFFYCRRVGSFFGKQLIDIMALKHLCYGKCSFYLIKLKSALSKPKCKKYTFEFVEIYLITNYLD